jgi:hypothetical protein
VQPYLKAIERAGMRVERNSFCLFPPFDRLCRKMGVHPCSKPATVMLDSLLASAFSWNYRYHATSSMHKLRPSCTFMVLTK